MVVKNTQRLRPKFLFLPLAPECTSIRLRITQNLVQDLFLCILYNFGSNGHYFKEEIPKWWFLLQKSTIDLSSTIIRLFWKFSSLLKLNKTDRRRSLFTCLIFHSDYTAYRTFLTIFHDFFLKFRTLPRFKMFPLYRLITNSSFYAKTVGFWLWCGSRFFIIDLF